jgi:hypothetical protein
MNISSSGTVIISDQVLSQEVNGETVLLDLEQEFYFGLDKTGTRIWQLLQSGSSVPELIESMLNEFEIDRTTLTKDVDELLEKLSDAGLVRIDPAS